MQFSINWLQVWATGKPFLLFVVGMVLYAVFIYAFYERVSRKFIFSFARKEYKFASHPGLLKFWSGLVYGFKYLFIAPLFLVFWFVIIACLLLLMNGDMAFQEGLLLGMSMLATIRITAYYNEHLAEDLGKILPLSMLALFLVDRTEINLPLFWDKLIASQALLGTLIVYFGFTVALEFLLRIYDAIANRE